MSEKNGPFNAAIRTLKDCMMIREHWRDGWGLLIPEDPSQLESVIAVLEAAGKVDKQYCIEVFEMFVKNTTLDPYDDIRYRKDGLAIFPISQIRTLLESLPEEKED